MLASLLIRIMLDHPDVEFADCESGGGRAAPGKSYTTPYGGLGTHRALGQI